MNLFLVEITYMFKKLMKLFVQIGYARAAHNLAVMGKYEEAKKLMMQKEVA